MKVYSPVALILLTISAIWVLPGLAAFQPDEVRTVAPVAESAELFHDPARHGLLLDGRPDERGVGSGVGPPA